MRNIFLFFILICFTLNLYASDGNLYEMFKDYSVIKVYLKEVINNTENPDIKIHIFKNIFKKAIEDRKNIKFEYVTDEGNADVIVNSRIDKYVFTKDAIPFFFSTASLIADLTAPKSSAKLAVDYEIVSPQDGKILLSFPNFTTNTRRPREKMQGGMGYAYAVKKNVDRFIFRAFYEQKEK